MTDRSGGWSLPDAVSHTCPQSDSLLLRHPGGEAGHSDPPWLRDADHLPALSSVAGLVEVLGQLGGLSATRLTNNYNYLDNRSSSSSSSVLSQCSPDCSPAGREGCLCRLLWEAWLSVGLCLGSAGGK